MNEFREELLGGLEKSTTPSKPLFNKKYIFLSIVVLIFGWYIGILLFGTNSIIRLNELESELENLENKTEKVTKENAYLQKELFEIRQIRGEN